MPPEILNGGWDHLVPVGAGRGPSLKGNGHAGDGKGDAILPCALVLEVMGGLRDMRNVVTMCGSCRSRSTP